MSDTDLGSFEGASAARSLERSAHLLLAGAPALAAALLGGLLLARAMRARHLHWGFTLPPLAAAAWLRGVLGPARPGAARAARRSRGAGPPLAPPRPSRRRRPGSPRARTSHRRAVCTRGPRARRGRARRARAGAPAGGACARARTRPSGSPRADLPSAVRRPPHARGRRDRLGQDGHADADRGASDRTGHGRDRRRPQGRSRACAMRLALAARDAERELLEWTPHGPSFYNPYARGGDTEIADRLLAGERFTEPHYLRQAQRYIGHAVRALRAAGEVVDLSHGRAAAGSRAGSSCACASCPGRRPRRASPTSTR